MTRREWPRILPLLALGLLCLGLLVLAGRGPARWEPSSAPEAADRLAAELALSSPPDDTLPPEAAFDIVVARNLFSVSRTPPPESVREAGPAAGSQDLSLAGVLLADGAAIALLRDRPGNRTVQLALGDSYRGWKLARLDQRRAVLRRGAETLTLDLVFAQGIGKTRPGGAAGVRRRVPLEPRRGDAGGNPVPASRKSLFEIKRGQPANPPSGRGG